jgi:hypothetical protein
MRQTDLRSWSCSPTLQVPILGEHVQHARLRQSPAAREIAKREAREEDAVRNHFKFGGISLFAVLLLACSGGKDDGMGGGNGGKTDSGADGDGSTDSDASVWDGSQTDGSMSDMDSSNMTPGNPCDVLTCGPGQRCDSEGSSAHCVDKSCDEVACKADEKCQVDPQGGHVCKDNSCQGDVGCGGDSYCKQGICQADVCTPSARHCDGPKVFECADNGGQDSMQFTCQNASYFESVCSASAATATCTCLDDWNCPANTVCETGLCEGTGKAPTCSLPAIPFSDTPPSVELFWGGTNRATPAAHDGTAAANLAPWSDWSMALNTPIVANLDDDNGDGLINELDFPEILFVTHYGNNPWSNGVVRAIHGGGPKKGADYFARCGTMFWTEGMPAPAACSDTDADADSGAPLAVGDLNNDGLPEIVYTAENQTFRILDHTGKLLFTSGTYSLSNEGDAPSIANLDFAGYAEIIIGKIVYVLGDDGSGGIKVTHVLTGTAAKGTNEIATMVCPADVIPSMPGLEIVAGGTLYKMPATLPTCGTPPCAGALDIVWNAMTVPGNTGISGEGYCAVADVWGSDKTMPPGPNNRPDGKPEVILIDNGDLTILNGETGAIISDRSLGGGDRGGAPNVDDFDGDGFMEVGSALQDFYVVVDLQTSTGAAGSCPDWPTVIARKDQPNGAHNPNPPRNPGGSCTEDSNCDPAAVCNRAVGHCVCLHNGWKRDSDDDSSRATSSSVFDFNGDGAAEAIYNDECDFRVYEGTTGELLFSQPSRSRTGIENPVVADVDNDGNAEVVTPMNTAEPNRCDDDQGGIPTGPNGIRVWGDPTDTWVSARRIWNEQSYHVTNVTESGSIPTHEPESWLPWGGRLYNTYRSQPRSFGVAPDLTVVGVGVSSPDAKCGSLSDNIDIAFEIENAGDLRVGPGVVVRFFGKWDGTEQPLKAANGTDLLELVLSQSLEPGKSVILKVNFAQQNNSRDKLPSEVRVVVDPTSGPMPNGNERECHEDNNSRSAPVDPGTLRADLTVEILSVTPECPEAKIQTKVRNLGSAPAENVVVRYYAGDPAQGGTMLHDQAIAAPIAPESEASFTVTLNTLADRGAITIYAVVDPGRTIDECNEANNSDTAETEVACNVGPQ